MSVNLKLQSCAQSYQSKNSFRTLGIPVNTNKNYSLSCEFYNLMKIIIILIILIIIIMIIIIIIIK